MLFIVTKLSERQLLRGILQTKLVRTVMEGEMSLCFVVTHFLSKEEIHPLIMSRASTLSVTQVLFYICAMVIFAFEKSI